MERRIWRVILTKPRAEKKVCDKLQKKNIDVFFAVNKTSRRLSNRVHVVHNPLFERYVFVNASDSELESIKQLDGVQQIIYWLDKPASISHQYINNISAFTSEHTNIKLERMPVNPLGKPIMLNEEALEDEDTSGTTTLCKAVLPALGYVLMAKVAKTIEEMQSVWLREKNVSTGLLIGSTK